MSKSTKKSIEELAETCQEFAQRIEALLCAVEVYANDEETSIIAIRLLDIAFEEKDFLEDNLKDLWFNITKVMRK